MIRPGTGSEFQASRSAKDVPRLWKLYGETQSHPGFGPEGLVSNQGLTAHFMKGGRQNAKHLCFKQRRQTINAVSSLREGTKDAENRQGMHRLLPALYHTLNISDFVSDLQAWQTDKKKE